MDLQYSHQVNCVYQALNGLLFCLFEVLVICYIFVIAPLLAVDYMLIQTTFIESFHKLTVWVDGTNRHGLKCAFPKNYITLHEHLHHL